MSNKIEQHTHTVNMDQIALDMDQMELKNKQNMHVSNSSHIIPHNVSDIENISHCVSNIENIPHNVSNIPHNISNIPQSCYRRYFEYVIFTIGFGLIVLSLVDLGIGISYINIPICVKSNTVQNTTISNSTIIFNNTYVTGVEKVLPVIDLGIWLIVNGFIWNYLIITSIFYSATKENQNYSTFFGYLRKIFHKMYPVLLFLSFLFLFCWLFVGAKSFWVDCGYDTIEKISIEFFMSTTLVFEFIGLFCILIWLLWLKLCNKKQ
jgi:hypothetical protein